MNPIKAVRELYARKLAILGHSTMFISRTAHLTESQTRSVFASIKENEPHVNPANLNNRPGPQRKAHTVLNKRALIIESTLFITLYIQSANKHNVMLSENVEALHSAYRLYLGIRKDLDLRVHTWDGLTITDCEVLVRDLRSESLHLIDCPRCKVSYPYALDQVPDATCPFCAPDKYIRKKRITKSLD